MSEQQHILFHAVDFAISRFSETLPYTRNTGKMGEIPPAEANAPVNAQLVFVHTLALTAQMRLHYLRAKDEPISYSRRLNAANSVVAVANELMGSNVDYSEFDMLLGVSFAFWLTRPVLTDSLRHRFIYLFSTAGRLRVTFSSGKDDR
jgi:hypothetical protein